jgi:hypothetical protein
MELTQYTEAVAALTCIALMAGMMSRATLASAATILLSAINHVFDLARMA